MSTRPDADRALSYQGHYAGPVSRLLAYLADIGIISVLFTLAGTLLGAALVAATPWNGQINTDQWWIAIVYFLWNALYFGSGWVLRGRSPGMNLLGLRIVRGDGSDLDARHALLRLVAFPLGFLTLGVGFLGIIFARRRTAIYDRIADTAVIYDWDARAAKLRALAHDAPLISPAPPAAGSADPARQGAGPTPG